jgi:hypothetical protein
MRKRWMTHFGPTPTYSANRRWRERGLIPAAAASVSARVMAMRRGDVPPDQPVVVDELGQGRAGRQPLDREPPLGLMGPDDGLRMPRRRSGQEVVAFVQARAAAAAVGWLHELLTHRNLQVQGRLLVGVDVCRHRRRGGLVGEAELAIAGHSEDGYDLVLSYDIG